jgi:hypothetical protein
MDGMPMEISPKYSIEDWNKLDLSKGAKEEDWKTGIDIFEDRMMGRFFIPINEIKGCRFAGFVIMGVLCLLIETLEQFRKGVEATPRKRGEGEKYFVSFLTTPPTQEKFCEADLAKKFYDSIRCGILHQAEIKGSSRIRIDVPKLMEKTEDGEGLIINRNLFIEKMEKELKSYIKMLRDDKHEELRANFIKKMDYICKKK